MIKKNSKFIISLVISIFFMWLVLKDIDYPLLWEQLRMFNWWILLLGLVLWLIGYGIRAWRWQVLLEPVCSISFRTSLEILVIGFTANNLLPLRAGEFVRSYVLGQKEDVPMATVFATVAAERVFDGLIIVGLTLIGALVVPMPLWMEQTIWVASGAFIGAFSVFTLLIFLNRQTMHVVGWLLHLLPGGMKEKAEGLLNVFTAGIEFLRDPWILMRVTLSSVSIWLIEAGFYYLAAQSFGFVMSFQQALFMKGILNLGILVPSAPGYVGTFEFFVIEALALISISETAALGYALVTHFVEFVAISGLGIMFWFKYGLSQDALARVQSNHADII